MSYPLEKVLEKCFQIRDETLYNMIGKKNKNGQVSKEAMEERINIYCDVLESHAKNLINTGEAIFDI